MPPAHASRGPLPQPLGSKKLYRRRYNLRVFRLLQKRGRRSPSSICPRFGHRPFGRTLRPAAREMSLMIAELKALYAEALLERSLVGAGLETAEK